MGLYRLGIIFFLYHLVSKQRSTKDDEVLFTWSTRNVIQIDSRGRVLLQTRLQMCAFHYYNSPTLDQQPVVSQCGIHFSTETVQRLQKHRAGVSAIAGLSCLM